MKRLASHLCAIGVALLVTFGILRLPPIGFSDLPGIFAAAWLLLATLVLLAHMRQAKLLGRRRQVRRVARQPVRKREYQ